MRQTLAWTMALLVAAFAGCAQEDPVPADHDHDDHDHGDGNVTVELAALLGVSVSNGTAPLVVNFTIGAEGPANATWSLDFGNGNSTAGQSVPAQANHTFTSNATVTLTVIAGNQTATAVQNITVAAAATETGPSLPEKTSFEFGESLGCVGDVLQAVGADCISAQGPSFSGIDGFWVELGPEYVGLALTTTIDSALHDSDCYFTDEDFNFIENANNGGAECLGTVPEGTAWMFLYSYAEPAPSQTAEFSLP